MGAGTHTEVRSDAAVFADARKRLDDSPTVPGTVRVHVAEGLVMLTGTVRYPSQRAEADRVVRPTIGSRSLVNNITVIDGSVTSALDPLDE